MTVHKSYEISSFKARPNDGEGTFEAIVSVFGNVDLQNDRVMPGAFEKSIQKWKDSGDPIPVLWSHDWGDPYAHIGYVDPADVREVRGKAGQVPGGLLVVGHLDVHKPFAKQVYDLLSERRVKEFSFSYDIPAGGEKRGKDGANELSTLDIIEIGPTLKGANPATVSLGTKSNGDIEEERRMKLRLDRAADIELKAAIEKASWDGAAAMRSCSSAADFRKIAFERANDSDPDTAAHWALPHHSSPGAEANPAGVAAALGALHGGRGGAPDLKSKGAAESHLNAHSGSEKAYVEEQHPRAAGGEWTAGDGGSNKPKPSDAELEKDKTHPLGEGTLNDLRKALREAGMPKEDVIALAHLMRDNFHESGKINIPKEADKFLKPIERARLGEAIRAEARKRGWKPPEEKSLGKPWHVEKHGDEYCVIKDADGSQVACHPTEAAAMAQVRALYANEKRAATKSGRVVGAKAAAALKDALAGAVDKWASDMNGTGEVAQEKKLDAELTEFNDIIANLEIKR
jgi:HK97 family phage prohead protease